MTRDEKILAGASVAALTAYFLLRRRPEAGGDTPPGSEGDPEGAGAPGRSWAERLEGRQPGGSWTRRTGSRTVPAGDHPVVCQRWLTGNARQPWGEAEWGDIRTAAAEALAHTPSVGVGLPALRERAFRATRRAIAMLCPTVPVPDESEHVAAFKARPDLGFWWDALWDGVYEAVWLRLVASEGGSL